MDAYIRVSRVAGRTGESYISPKVQREQIERWAEYKGVEIVRWHVDEDWSGGTHDRPGLDAAIEHCLSGESDGIVSAKIDRFSRFTEAGLRDLRRLDAANARLAFVMEDIDTSGPIGKFVYTIMLAMAEYFLDQIKASWIVAKERAVRRGAKISRTPWGYQRNEDGTLSPHPERAEIVSEAFRLAASENIQAAMTYLRRVAPERGWNTTKVRRLLSQTSYLGETRYGDDLVQPGTHEPLVSRAVFEAAKDTPTRRRPKEAFPLSGFAQCGTCGQHMVGARSGRNGDRTYRCSASLVQNSLECERPAVITAHLIENYVRGIAEEFLVAHLDEVVATGETGDIDLLEQVIIEAEAELDAFASDLTLRRALGKRYHDHLQTRVDAVEQAQAAYRKKARESQEHLALSVEDLLDPEHPERLLVGLRGLFGAIVVVPGRLPVAERVRILPLEDERSTGKLRA